MSREDGESRRLRTLIAALKLKTVANGCTEAEARAATAKVAELQSRLDTLAFKAAEGAAARDKEAREQAAREKAARQDAARRQAEKERAERERAELAEFERLAREQAARQAKEAPAAKERPTQKPASPEPGPRPKEPARSPAAFAVGPGKVDVFTEDDRSIIDAIHAATRSLGPDFAIFGVPVGERDSRVRGLVSRLLQAGELRDRDGNVLSSVTFNGSVLHRTAPRPAGPILGGLFSGSPVRS